MSALVKLGDVSKRYGDAIALYPTNLSIESGKTTVLIGPSGCGKSTLLRLIIRLIEPDSGSIEFDGKPVTPDNINALRRRIGYVIQEGGLFPHLTARANVLLMARHIGKSEEETHNRLLELSELTRFSEKLLPRYPVELSGGQRQRVSLMRALMLSPELFCSMSRSARSIRWCALRCKKISRKFSRALVRRWFSSLTIWRKRFILPTRSCS